MALSVEELRKASDYAVANYKLLWSLFTEGGRGKALTGQEAVSDEILEIVRNSYIADSSPIYDIEIPLIGEPKMDLTIGYYAKELPYNIDIIGDGLQNCKNSFEHYAELYKNENENNEICFEYDASAGLLECPAFGYIPVGTESFSSTEYIRRINDYLTLVNQEHRSSKVLEVYSKSPDYWKPFYQGIALSRQDSPMRITWLWDENCKKMYLDNPEQIENDFEKVGLSIDRKTMIEPMLEIIKNRGDFELQADMKKDGTLGSAIGLGCFLGRNRSDTNDNGGFGDYIKLGHKWGIADERTSFLIPETRKHTITYYDDKKGTIRKQLLVGHTNLKFIWIKNELMPMKAYVFLKSNVVG